MTKHAEVPPEPRTLITLDTMWQAPHIRWAQLHSRELLPSARVSRGESVTVLPRRPIDLAGCRFEYCGREWGLTEAMARTDADGWMVIHDGAIVLERYAGEMTAETRHLCQSVSKSMTSALPALWSRPVASTSRLSSPRTWASLPGRCGRDAPSSISWT